MKEANKSIKKKNNHIMRKILISLLTVVVFGACNNSTKNMGEQFTASSPISLDAALQQADAEEDIKNIQIEGKIEQSCMSKGCWFTLKDASGNEVLLDVLDEKFKVPTNSAGKEVVVLADIRKDSTSEQKYLLSVKGMMFK